MTNTDRGQRHPMQVMGHEILTVPTIGVRSAVAAAAACSLPPSAHPVSTASADDAYAGAGPPHPKLELGRRAGMVRYRIGPGYEREVWTRLGFN